jgi:hypothetical protein
MVLAHMVRRVAGLVLLGVVFVNLDNYNAAATVRAALSGLHIRLIAFCAPLIHYRDRLYML